MQLEGKIALVTGGTKGIGAATAQKLASLGADIVINGRHDNAEAKDVVTAVEALGRRCKMIVADMAVPDDAIRSVEETVAAFGRIDIVVHNAGGGVVGGFMEVAPEEYLAAFDVHVHAAFHLGRAAVPHMRATGGGSIILISSVAGIRGCPGAFAYGVVKGALPQFARAMARDLASDNNRVNAVSPGIVLTSFHDAMTPEQKRHHLDNRIPLHRFGASEDVADVIALLAGNDFITGENYVIDGGMTMRIV
jgi:3-oxoacyl-[acyl-carrier protein] reductase